MPPQNAARRPHYGGVIFIGRPKNDGNVLFLDLINLALRTLSKYI